MEIMWESPARSLTGRDVANRLPRYAYTTVATVLDRIWRARASCAGPPRAG